MGEHFNFESRCRVDENDYNIRMLTFRTLDDTMWTVFEEWMYTQKTPQTYIQRLTFRKDNFYMRKYVINVEVSSVKYKGKGTLTIEKETNGVFTKIVIPLHKFEIFDYPIFKELTVIHNTELDPTVAKDRFRYKVTLTRNGDDLPAPRGVFTFSDQMLSLLETEIFSDFTLIVGSTEIKVHKNILAARCVYFRNMINSDTIEVRSGIAHIHDIDIKTLKEILRFIYSGVLRPMTVSELRDLCIETDKLVFDELRNACESAMENHIAPANAVSLLLVADQCRMVEMKKLCFECIEEAPKGAITKQIVPENAASLLLIADEFRMVKMVALCLKYARKNYSNVKNEDRNGNELKWEVKKELMRKTCFKKEDSTCWKIPEEILEVLLENIRIMQSSQLS